ncbi:uncharacterized protein LOC111401419 [Olea europaea var. sylvestris]|uniref:uncharacterized protein LOC111401419 n=1 Tax=Olea europaea var. sylvestris TaxID=158386 RepID=UPI000C1CDA4E|nr:uncharacterized protein LOC111401419 [Olea europaea var. sylvestris]
MTIEEFRVASIYVLLNCEEVTPFVAEFDKHMRILYPQISNAQFDGLREEHFSSWLREYVLDDHKAVDNCIKALAMGPSRTMVHYNGYFVNCFKFHTLDYGSNKATMNSGVCVVGSCHTDYERDYYGRLIEILELEYLGDFGSKVILFKCDWFDTNGGVRVHRRFNLVELNHKKKL